MESNKPTIQTKEEHSVSILPEKLDIIYSSSEVKLTEHVSNLTPQKAFGGAMSNFKKKHPAQLFDSIEKLLALLSMSLNIKNNLEPHQLAPLARAIYGKYYFYSLDEFALILRMGKQGELISKDEGKMYGKLDEETIMTWFKIYDDRFREAFVIQERTRQNEENRKGNIDGVLENLGGYDLVKKFTEDLISEDQRRKNDMQEYRERYFKTRKPDAPQSDS
jgi:hypothetical protein